MGRGRLHIFVLGSTAAACLLPITAQAQLEEILVTAQKRTETLLNVPTSVTVLTGDKIDTLGVRELQDLVNFVPGLTVQDGGGVGRKVLTMRGLTTNTASRMMGIYVDDVPFGSDIAYSRESNNALELGFSDLAQVEVLRGPQGTLYGASAMAGILKYVTKAPNLTKFEAKAETALGVVDGSDTDYTFRAMANAPIVDGKVAVRANVYYQRFGGYIDDPRRGKTDTDGADVWGGRVQLLLQPTDNLKVRLTAMSQNLTRDGTSYVDWNITTRQPLYGDLVQQTIVDQPAALRFRQYSVVADYDLGFATLTAVVAKQENKATNLADYSRIYTPLIQLAAGINLPIYTGKFSSGYNKNTAELRLASATGGRFDWLVGGYYAKESQTNFQNVSGYTAIGVLSPINFAQLALPSNYREEAIFANGTFHVTDKWDISGGLRGSRDDQAFTQEGSGLLIGSAPRGSSREFVGTWQASTRYALFDKTNFYARVATGYRPGGPNAVGRDPLTGAFLAPPTFGPDRTTNYELGVKSEINNWLQFDVTGYWVKWKNIQLSAARNGISVLANGKSARSRGLEAQLAARPFQGMTIGAAFTYTNAELTADAPDLSAKAGARLPTVPRFAWSLIGDYEWPVFSGWNGSVGGTLAYVGDRSSSFNSASQPNIPLDRYATVDVRAGINNDLYSIQLFIQNLADERGMANATATATPASSNYQVAFVRPRTVGARFSVQF